jgi:hypothetical protein
MYVEYDYIHVLLAMDEGIAHTNSDTSGVMSYNEHYCVPHNLSGIFTGRNEVVQKLCVGCLPQKSADAPQIQKRFVLLGLGGSGKTHISLKFAQDYRERWVYELRTSMP